MTVRPRGRRKRFYFGTVCAASRPDGALPYEHMFVGCKVRPNLLEKYREARARRSTGQPIKRIAKDLGVSPGTVHRWTTDIELTDEQQAAIDQAAEERWTRRAVSWSETCRQRRRGYQEEGRRKAAEGDLLHAFGCMLYWAEGAKDRNSLAFANSDPKMVHLFVRFLHETLEVSDEQIVLRLNVYLGNGLSLEEIENYWLETLGLPRSVLRGHQINHFPTSSSGRRPHKLPYGVCTVRVSSTRLVQHVFGAIQEYSGFEQPGWLDGPRPSAAA